MEPSYITTIAVGMGSSIAMAVGLFGFSFLVPKMPHWFFFGTPNLKYWTSEENRPIMDRRLQLFYEFICVDFLFFCLLAQWKIFQLCQNPANVDNSVRYAGIVLIIFTVIEGIRYGLSFRLPKEKDDSRSTD
jgi:hypothetical protein